MKFLCALCVLLLGSFILSGCVVQGTERGGSARLKTGISF